MTRTNEKAGETTVAAEDFSSGCPSADSEHYAWAAEIARWNPLVLIGVNPMSLQALSGVPRVPPPATASQW
jgi:hypothetical protein